MNRAANLERASASWRHASGVDEIVVLDWGSNPVVQMDDSFRVVRVDGVKEWHLSRAYNVAIRLISTDIVCKVDADYVLQPDFFRSHVLEPGSFYAGNWAAARTPNETHLSGFLVSFRDDFLRANGYNERISRYGYEDTDLYDRLVNLGLKRLPIDLDKISHIPHSPHSRRVHQGEFDLRQQIRENRKECEANPWTADDRMSSFQLSRRDGREFCVMDL